MGRVVTHVGINQDLRVPIYESQCRISSIYTGSGKIFLQILRFLPVNYLLTYSMEQSPSSEANRFAASQEIPRIL